MLVVFSNSAEMFGNLGGANPGGVIGPGRAPQLPRAAGIGGILGNFAAGGPPRTAAGRGPFLGGRVAARPPGVGGAIPRGGNSGRAKGQEDLPKAAAKHAKQVVMKRPGARSPPKAARKAE